MWGGSGVQHTVTPLCVYELSEAVPFLLSLTCLISVFKLNYVIYF
uniref:Uncharacterized protein n=1 Tax=Anguilla anguilla TaxID=7936 RepID=A0A0E9U7J3_ANGAN